MRRVADFFEGPFVLVYGDVLTDLNLADLIAFHRRQPARAFLSMSLYQVSNPWACGVVNLDTEGRVTRFVEKPFREDSFSQLANAGVLVTNQSAIGRGIITMGQAVEINRRVIAEIESWGGRIDAWYMCPRHPEEGCDCRKPMPGMLRQAEREVGVDLSRSFLIGDAVSDIQAARAVGTRGILVLTGRGQEQLSILKAQGSADCPVVANLQAAVDYIMEYGK